ncbi:hypothetical protein [Laribacter hongkongensis]|nr:hypothetical protein [Laribacter hongkongensis]MCG9040720.1 hypothetical protein [Laribacter hongkongensis]MCG9109480.1 hypothetical protein [Laribacter hongkongensis]MCG9120388.1 hypothetical protein [Laribacter hongkongensis]
MTAHSDLGFASINSFGVVCHDAGGANQIFAMIRRWGAPESITVEGPARKIWQRDFADAPSKLEEGLQWISKISTLLTGTSWGSDIEHRARKVAKQHGVRSIAVLDHWTNYSERFSTGSDRVLPDEIWVVDRYAYEMARRIFPSILVSLKCDCYSQYELESIASITSSTPNEVLYLSEPARADWGRGEPGEMQAIRYFMECIPRLNLPRNTIVRLRPHPSDDAGKYDIFLERNNGLKIELDSGRLTDSLSRCRWTAGCQTYAMTLALGAGRVVYGSLPPWAPECKLPHDGIVHLRKQFP